MITQTLSSVQKDIHQLRDKLRKLVKSSDNSRVLLKKYLEESLELLLEMERALDEKTINHTAQSIVQLKFYLKQDDKKLENAFTSIKRKLLPILNFYLKGNKPEEGGEWEG